MKKRQQTLSSQGRLNQVPPSHGEAEPFIKDRDKFEEDQLLNVLHETSMPVLEVQVAQVDK
eukprot:49800-Prorocentrum_lima.AAC.1